MKAYRSIGLRGELATADRLQLWDKVHCNHKDVHDGEVAALKMEAGMQVRKRDRKVAEKMMTQATTAASMKAIDEAAAAKRAWQVKCRANAKLADLHATKKRKAKHQGRVASGEVHYDSPYIPLNKKRE